MCGRYGFSVKDAREVYDRFGVMNKLADLMPRYNIAPGQNNPVAETIDEYQTFLSSLGYEPVAKAAFGKTI